ncbi:hypothetical protein GCM10010359_39170 [Streptomyces morookaense]|uniref:Uncharacterized protein n=2 Tax=Streptomyces morookaense TaxID=1970 RepID=A0A7Y7B438_STRMO|nr:hypothetical protein [Streptomyces morookaense]GHF32637.1 hypothetical protein GCM10010359_39170 [Streptomyces morookaense]
MISHATPVKRDMTYDRRAQQTAVPIDIHHRDGTAERTLLILTPDEMESLAIRLEQAIDKRHAVPAGSRCRAAE